MAIQNPVFSRIEQEQKQGRFATFRTEQPQASAGMPPTTSADLEHMYGAPSATTADTGRLTYDDVIMKTLAQFVVLVAAATVSWVYVSRLPQEHLGRGLALVLLGMFGGLVVGIAIAMKRTISVPLILGYAVLEGVFVGAISQYFESAYDGIVGQAVVGTLAGFAGMLAAYKFGLIKVNDKFRRIFGFALMGYFFVGLASFVAALFGVGGGFGFYGAGPLGLLLCAVGVGFAAISLALNFDTIDKMVAAGAPAKTSWLLGHGLLVTLVWLYIELLRLLAILRGDN